MAVQQVSAATTLTNTTSALILGNTATAGFQITLPLAASAAGATLIVCKSSTDYHNLSVAPQGSDTIAGVGGVPIGSLGNNSGGMPGGQGNPIALVSDGISDWKIEAGPSPVVTLTNTTPNGPYIQMLSGVYGNIVMQSNNAMTLYTGNASDLALNLARGLALNTVQGTLSGTTAGSITWYQPLTGTGWKRVLAYLTGYQNNTATAQAFTFQAAFTKPPYLARDDSGGATASTSTLTLPVSMATAKTGWVVVEGF
jgi:hypothetical protein